jgi:hypothetical protein
MLNRKWVLALALATVIAGCGGAAGPAQNSPASGSPSNSNTESSAPVAAPQEAAAADKPAAAPTNPVAPGQTSPTTTSPAPAAPANPAAPVASPPSQPKAAAPAVTESLKVETLQQGAYSGVTERKAVLIADEAAWRAQWQQSAANQVPVPAAPPVDFSKNSLVAVYMGEQRTGGYSVRVTSAQLIDSTLVVTVQETRPSPGSMVTMALTQPFHVVRIPQVPAGTELQVIWK